MRPRALLRIGASTQHLSTGETVTFLMWRPPLMQFLIAGRARPGHGRVRSRVCRWVRWPRAQMTLYRVTVRAALVGLDLAPVRVIAAREHRGSAVRVQRPSGPRLESGRQLTLRLDSRQCHAGLTTGCSINVESQMGNARLAQEFGYFRTPCFIGTVCRSLAVFIAQFETSSMLYEYPRSGTKAKTSGPV